MSGQPRVRALAPGDGWAVSDVVCTAGPMDRPFEEQHSGTSIAVVLSGTFQYRCLASPELMTPGCLLLGNAGDAFCCGHEHGSGDRCVAFWYAPEFFEGIARDAGSRTGVFQVSRLPPIRSLSPVVAKVSRLLWGEPDRLTCDELCIQLAAQVIQVASGIAPSQQGAAPSSLARVTEVIRMMEHQMEVPHDLKSLSQVARLSPYHFLRTFVEVTGTTPHQYLVRARLRQVAVRLKTETTKIIDIALGCGFGDVSNFNRMFRAEFGVSPRAYRTSG